MPVVVTCRVVAFSKQSYYKWVANPVPDRDWDEAVDRARPTCGAATGSMATCPVRPAGGNRSTPQTPPTNPANVLQHDPDPVQHPVGKEDEEALRIVRSRLRRSDAVRDGEAAAREPPGGG